ncbi:MAG: CHAP domain-containing protein [Candidatus Berkelbacteria bacterium]|nr:CHAP domain-containing protein [Candidatus Berkelbacteria bacterium]
MTTDQFVTKYNNKFIDWDGYWGAQCVDLYRQFLKEVCRVPQNPPVVGAKDIWNNYRKEDFVRIPNGPYNFPQKGDIVIWNKNAGGGFGHVGVCLVADSMRFTSFDQNWIQVSAHKQPHNYTNVIGWLRFKKNDIIEPLNEPLVLTGRTSTIEEAKTTDSGTPSETPPPSEEVKAPRPVGRETPTEELQPVATPDLGNNDIPSNPNEELSDSPAGVTNGPEPLPTEQPPSVQAVQEETLEPPSTGLKALLVRLFAKLIVKLKNFYTY